MTSVPPTAPPSAPLAAVPPEAPAARAAAHPDAALSPRHVQVHALLDAGRGRGLEVGPLNVPIVRRGPASDVRYVDVHDRAALQDHYRSHDGFPLDDIVEPDFVLLHEGGVRSLPEAAGADGPYDWVVASHVVEHVPDLLGWLGEVAEVLVDDGALVLAVPDRRFCFDVRREPTTVGQVLQAWRDGDRRPSVRAVYDHVSRCHHVAKEHIWRGEQPGERMYTPSYALSESERARAGDYVDCHVWVWTPGLFVEQVAELAGLDLHELVVDRVVDTPFDDLEFYVRLRRLPRGLSREQRDARRAAALTSWTDLVVPGRPEPEPDPVGGLDDDRDGVAATLSPSEARLVLAKRRALHRARRLLGRG